jgi:hypothetical protein
MAEPNPDQLRKGESRRRLSNVTSSAPSSSQESQPADESSLEKEVKEVQSRESKEVCFRFPDSHAIVTQSQALVKKASLASPLKSGSSKVLPAMFKETDGGRGAMGVAMIVL